MTDSPKDTPTGGVQAMSIQGRMADERERCIGMTNEERAWRARWLKDQILDHDEPKVPEGYWKARYNPIRRFYRAPMDKLEGALIPKIGEELASTVRHISAKLAMGIMLTYFGFYYFKYNRATWMSKSGWFVMQSRKTVIPGDPDWPNYEDKPKANQYHTHGFENSPI